MQIIVKTFAIIGIIAVSGLCLNAMQNYHAATDISKQQRDTPNNDYNVYALPIPEHLEFAGEPVPLHQPDIRERLDRELLVNVYWQSNGLLLLKRANKYFPLIEPLLKKYGLPDDFKYLCVAESALQNNRSPAGAAGFWHFLKTTGREHGLEINDYVDERYNLELATQVAATYLKNSKERFGNWTLAAAAYNAGNAGIAKQIARQNAPNNYYDLLLNSETSRYLFRIIALKQIMTHPGEYGFNFDKSDLYQTIPTYNVKVDTAVTDLAQFAKAQGINYKILKLHNPWLRENYLKNGSGKEYLIKIPKKGYYNAQK